MSVPDARPPEGDPVAQAESLLAAARQAGDRGRESAALTDLGVVALRGGEAPRAAAVLDEALTLARASGEPARETDVLLYLGLALLAVRQPSRAVDALAEALWQARTTGDRFAEKLALDHLGVVYGAVRDFPHAIACQGQALALATALGDRQHEADLLWSLAIHNAELGRKEQAVAAGQAALALFAQLGSPHVDWLAGHLRQYQLGDAGPGGSRRGIPPALPGTVHGWAVVVSGASPPAPAPPKEPARGPGLLRMAMSAVTSLARFVASGAKTVSPLVHQRRLEVCAPCEQHTGLRCRVCGCFTDLKARLPHERCPLGKWPE